MLYKSCDLELLNLRLLYYTNELLVHIIVILDTKGPLAYIRFANCLFSLDNDVHTQLYLQSQTQKTHTHVLGKRKLQCYLQERPSTSISYMAV